MFLADAQIARRYFAPILIGGVDSGETWQYYADGAWTTYSGDITDKEAIYAVANDSATLNALGEADVALLIPPETLVKRIRFLTLLTQETLQSATITRSVSVESMRRGRYESVPAAQFSETVSFGNLAIKYIGTAALAELRLLISVSEGKR
ncbi:MAG: hypothetical protein LBF86_07010 [Helicobacteraceae bacterium]|nr:hypothetical protein [Helicobacteraceae bacterium]